MDSLDNSMESVESLDNVHGYSGQSPGSPLPGHYPLTQWKVWTLSTDTLDNVQADRTISAESLAPWTLSMDKVHLCADLIC